MCGGCFEPFLNPRRTPQMKRIAFALAAVVVFLTGCNTLAGIGKDVQRAGEAVEDVAKKK
jgi:predicted small secreted protein